MERIKMDPIESLRGVKHFQDFKNANFRPEVEGVKHPSLDTIKWKESKWTPFGFCFTESLRGIKSSLFLNYLHKIFFFSLPKPYPNDSKIIDMCDVSFCTNIPAKNQNISDLEKIGSH